LKLLLEIYDMQNTTTSEKKFHAQSHTVILLS
jgi:hypothetical protein